MCVTSSETPLPRILLVDDNADNVALMRLYLGDSPYRVDEALNGREAVQCCTADRYDLIFMDLEMPELDGYTATRDIRSLEQARRQEAPTPIVVLTAHSLEVFRDRCTAAGCTDFLLKPVRKAEFLSTVARFLNREPAPAVATEARPDLEQLRPLFPLFFSTAAKTLDTAGKALGAGDLETAGRQGHRLKGSALSYGFTALGQAAADLERAGEARDAAAAQTALEQAKTQLTLARQEALG